MRCKICYKATDKELCSSKCEDIMTEAKNRVELQEKELNKVLNKVFFCKECNKPRNSGRTLCRECLNKKKREEAKKNRIKKVKYCINENCRKEIDNPSSNSKRYCSEECRKSARKSRQKEDNARYRAKKKIEKALKEGVCVEDKYKGTVNPYFLTRGRISTSGRGSVLESSTTE